MTAKAQASNLTPEQAKVIEKGISQIANELTQRANKAASATADNTAATGLASTSKDAFYKYIKAQEKAFDTYLSTYIKTNKVSEAEKAVTQNRELENELREGNAKADIAGRLANTAQFATDTAEAFNE
jgi:glycerol-3-phosphate O-acyltransferase